MTEISKEVEVRIKAAISLHEKQSPRGKLARDGFLGASDIGFCRQKAKLVVSQTPPSDSQPKWSAFVGTAVGKEIELAIHAAYPEWKIGSIDNLNVVATFPSGSQMGGHPDIVAPDLNAVLDIKTVDGLTTTRRNGTSLPHKYQRHIYALACIQMGILDGNSDVYVGNLYFDRSGKEPDPYIVIEPMDWTLTNEIDSWIQDVIYAVKNNEDASRDVTAPVCERICEFFTICRGGLPIQDGVTIEDPELLAAIDMHLEASRMEKEARDMKDAAKDILGGVNGQTADYQVRWTNVGPAEIPASTRSGYMRLDIRPVKKRLPA